MRKSVTGGSRVQGVPASAEELIEVQLPLGMLATLEDVQQGFFSLCVAAGREVLTAMMEREREALCGPKWIANAQRSAVRGGTTKSEVTLGGRRAADPARRGGGGEGRAAPVHGGVQAPDRA